MALQQSRKPWKPTPPLQRLAWARTALAWGEQLQLQTRWKSIPALKVLTCSAAIQSLSSFQYLHFILHIFILNIYYTVSFFVEIE